MSWRVAPAAALITLMGGLAFAQAVPQPFPRAGSAEREAQPPTTPARPPTTTAQPQTGTAPPPAEVPTEATLGVPIHPGSQFITSYNAGMGQRYYLFGSAASFADLVAYYRTALKQRGDVVFEEPPTHMFETGRFREDSMAFPPSVTIKDYTWLGQGGYLNPKPGAKPPRFPTVIQIVPPPR